MGKWRNGWFLLVGRLGQRDPDHRMDIYGLPDSLKTAWQLISGGQ